MEAVLAKENLKFQMTSEISLKGDDVSDLLRSLKSFEIFLQYYISTILSCISFQEITQEILDGFCEYLECETVVNLSSEMIEASVSSAHFHSQFDVTFEYEPTRTDNPLLREYDNDPLFQHAIYSYISNFRRI